ncbi:hypothetical protein D1816_11325 [Aquimarina sp. AD10]|uniref:nucleoside monophosphate kinase n=1 Tax=Aquimarina sp. AD10 TaxID=1714849 RepID=UPI000E50708E|nr:nucleoside monophosphate kinase [Aquimarina sp. AD10]AXT60913.1 hypothetical protein D1816_11325 [Aquimarina sp. AD10]RKM95555.1 hypothetical protein D7033_16800 [Aquimarina sp. AD10]
MFTSEHNELLLYTTEMKQCHLITSTSFSSQKGFEDILVEIFDLTKLNIQELLINKLRNDSNSDLANDIKKQVEKGELVSTTLITELIREKIIEIKNEILIIGYPRTKEQLDYLTNLLSENGFEIIQLWILELNNIERLIEGKDQQVSTAMIKKFDQTKYQNKEISELIDCPEITTKMEFEYPMEWDTYKIRSKIKDVYNTIYSK